MNSRRRRHPEASIAVAEARTTSAEALSTANAEFELTGQRTALPVRCDPVALEAPQVIGNFRLNGIHPQVLQSPQREPFDGP